VIDPDHAEGRVNPEQLYVCPAEPVRLGAVPVEEVAGVGPDARPGARLEAGAGIAVGGEGKEGLAPADRAVSGRSWRGFSDMGTPCPETFIASETSFITRDRGSFGGYDGFGDGG
jgi:hypothetical protein